MEHKIRLVASDLDGTLLLNGAQTLQEDTCHLIRELTERGVIFLAASGRQYANLRRLFAPVKDEIAYLCENGCLSFLHGKMLHKETMDRALGQEIIRTIQERDGCEVLLSGVDTSYLQPKKMSYYYHMRDVVKNNVTLLTDLFAVKEPYFKISVYEEGGLRDASYWKEHFGDRCTVVTSGNDWLDLMPKGVHKGFALKKILQALQISPNECLAFGDNYNDREMLSLVGFPAAVQTAKPEIRRMCRYETGTVEHALEKLLRHPEWLP